jgi:predicted lipoprotein with Yx(FWY)xxD motif
MRFARFVLVSLLLTLFAASVAYADPAAAPPAGDPPIRKLNGHLVDAKGRGLYTWDGDIEGNSSQCNSQCRLLWPPLYADDNAVPKGPFDLVKRDDGRYQWALRGRPLYRWASDKKWGDAGGDGVADMWRLVKVTEKKATQ